MSDSQKIWLRKDFERYVRKLNHKANVERADDGGYKHYGTELSWSIFQHAFRLGQKTALIKSNALVREVLADMNTRENLQQEFEEFARANFKNIDLTKFSQPEALQKSYVCLETDRLWKTFSRCSSDTYKSLRDDKDFSLYLNMGGCANRESFIQEYSRGFPLYYYKEWYIGKISSSALQAADMDQCAIMVTFMESHFATHIYEFGESVRQEMKAEGFEKKRKMIAYYEALGFEHVVASTWIRYPKTSV